MKIKLSVREFKQLFDPSSADIDMEDLVNRLEPRLELRLAACYEKNQMRSNDIGRQQDKMSRDIESLKCFMHHTLEGAAGAVAPEIGESK